MNSTKPSPLKDHSAILKPTTPLISIASSNEIFLLRLPDTEIVDLVLIGE
jgi:hypothetical protein